MGVLPVKLILRIVVEGERGSDAVPLVGVDQRLRGQLSVFFHKYAPVFAPE
jgi:hypothetical protein